MTYINPNAPSVASNNQAGVPQLVTQGVTDPVAIQNFEILNRYLQKTASLKNRGKANITFSPTNANKLIGTGPTGVFTIIKPPDLQTTVVSYGNPIRVKLGGIFYGQAYPSQLNIGCQAPNVGITFGWYRGTTIVWNCNLTWALPGVSGYVFPIPIPAFEFDDVVPSGRYTYQFYYQISTASTDILYRNLNVVAYELR